MSGDSLGTLFKIHCFGESHGEMIGTCIEGCPPGIPIDTNSLQQFISKRSPGNENSYSSPRQESDHIEIVSGILKGKTLGSPICVIVKNTDTKSNDYENLKDVYRPGHGDFSYFHKYGIRDHRGGGRSSGRITVSHMISGGIAKQILNQFFPNLEAISYTDSILDLQCPTLPENVTRESIEKSILKCPDVEISKKMELKLANLAKIGDTAGGTVRCIIKEVPSGLGEPIFDKLHADLGKACLGINSCKSFEIGDGFHGCNEKGSQQNDLFSKTNDGTIITTTNHCGGILAGISNGMPIIFRAGFKPISSIKIPQITLNYSKSTEIVKIHGRHDTCHIPRIVPIVEAVSYIVICDHFLRNRGQNGGYVQS